MKNRVAVTISALATLGAGACGLAEDVALDDVGESREAIINGSPVAVDTWGNPKVESTGFCSGTLVRNRWVLTAKHCNTGVGSTITMRDGSSTQCTNPIFNHPNYDVTVARLNASLWPQGDLSLGGPFPLYKGSQDMLLNQTVYCQGWGNNACGPSGCSGAGTLRSASMLIDQASTADPGYCGPECYRMIITNNRLLANGDSGTTCFQLGSIQTKSKVTGVFAGWNGSTTNYVTAAPRFRDWAIGIIGGAPSLGQLAGYERPEIASSVLYVHPTSSHVIELALGASGNWGRGDLTTATGSPNAASTNTTALVREDGTASVVFRDTNNQIQEITRTGVNGLTVARNNLSQLTGAPAAKGNPAGFGRSDRIAVVYYRSTDDHVQELSRDPGGTWFVNDLTAITGAPTASSDPVGYVRADGSNAVVFRSSDNHVRELWLPFGGFWSAGDLTAAAGAVNTHGSAIPRPYTRSDGYSIVLYRSQDGHIRELFLSSSGGGWGVADLTVSAGAPNTISDPFGYVRSDDIPAVIFKSNDNHVRELRLSGSWLHTDLTSTTGSAAAGGFGMAAYVRADRKSAVVYRTSDNHVHEFSLTKSQSTWTHTDLTTASGGTI
jgi:hypothetical protein